MTKIVIILILKVLVLSALDWKSYPEAIELQKSNNKPIMLDVVRTHCQYCKKMEKNVFADKEMSTWLQERFIVVKINLDFENLPITSKVQMTPTFYFLDKNKEIIKTIPGSWNIQDFKDLTKNIKGD